MAVTPDILLLILLMLLSAAAGYGLGCVRTRRLLRAASEKQTEATVDRLPSSADGAAAEEGEGIPRSAPTTEPARVGVEAQAEDGAIAEPSARESGSAEAVAASAPSPTLRMTGAALGAGNPLSDPPADAEKDPQDVLSRVRPAAPVLHRARQAPKRTQQKDSEDQPGSARPLMQIRGIGPRLGAALAAQGITSLEQVASWSAGDAARMGEAVKAPGRPQREDWSGQARHLLALAADAPPAGHFFPQEPAPVAPDVEPEAQSGLLFPELASAPRAGRRRRRSP